MPNPKNQSISVRIEAALRSIRKGLSCLKPGVGAASAIAIPILPTLAVTNPIALDPLMANILAGLGIVAGVTLGVVYRSMSETREALRKKAETSDAELRAVLTMTDDAVLLIDSLGTVRGANPAAEELFGQSIDRLLGEELQKLIAYPVNLQELTRNGPASFKTTALQPQGSSKVNIVLSEVNLTKGTSFLALVRDENATVTQQQFHAAPLDLAGPVSTFSHDLNNVLTGIIGNLSLILMTAPPDAATSERITGAKRNAIRAQELNRKLLALAKGEECQIDQPSNNTRSALTIVPMPSMMATPLAPQKPLITSPESRNKGHMRVLVLDDEEAICALVSTALGALGYDVAEAYDGEQAVRAFEEAKSAGHPFELVISDLSLPGNVNGEEAVRRMRAIDPAMKAIVSSGYDSDPVMSRYREHGFCAAISKPYDIAKLGRVVTSALAAEEVHRKTA